MGSTSKSFQLFDLDFVFYVNFQAEEFDGSSNPVIAFKGVKVGDFNGKYEKMFYEIKSISYDLGRTLSCINTTLIRPDPTETQRTVELRVWFDNEGKSMDLPDLSKAGDVGNRQSQFLFSFV